MNLYECKVGDVVATGDNYGMDACVCIKEKHRPEDCCFDAVIFLNLTDGGIYKSGGVDGVRLDDCRLIDRVSVEQVEKIKKVWSNE